MSEDQLPSITAAAALADPGLTLIDVRKAAARGDTALQGAAWHDPMTLDHGWAAALPARPVAVFCAHGHEVSQFACALARLHGADARHVTGGFGALVAAVATVERRA